MASGSILLVDDDPGVRESVRFLLELEGYQVRAVTAPIAMALIGCQHMDLVLLDFDMPLVDGSLVRDYLLSDPATAGIPVVALGEADQLRRQQRHLMAQGALAKPINYDALISEVAKHLPTKYVG